MFKCSLKCFVWLGFVLLSSFSHCVVAQTTQINVHDAWVRATVVGEKTTSVYFTLNTNQEVSLISAYSPVSSFVEIYEMQANVMKMQKLDHLNIPASVPFKFSPSGYHLMLIDLKHTLQKGQQVPVRLEFKNAKEEQFYVEFKANVVALDSKDAKDMATGSVNMHHEGMDSHRYPHSKSEHIPHKNH